MAEENKSPDVELDTDGVNEQNVEVQEAKEPDESFAQKENVDLGYTDVSTTEDNVTGDKTAKELLQETKEVEAKHVAEGFLSLALANRTSAHILTVDGGNIEASLR